MSTTQDRPMVPPKPEKDMKHVSAGDISHARSPMKHTVETQVNMMVMRNSSSSSGTRSGNLNSTGIPVKENTSSKPALPPKPKTSPLSPLAKGVADNRLENGNTTAEIVATPPPRAAVLISQLNSQLKVSNTSKPPKAPISPLRPNQNTQFRFSGIANSNFSKQPQSGHGGAPVAKIEEIENLSDLSNTSSPNSLFSPPPTAQQSVLKRASKFGFVSPPSSNLSSPIVTKGISPQSVHDIRSIKSPNSAQPAQRQTPFPGPTTVVKPPLFSPDAITLRQKKSVSLGRNVNPKAPFTTSSGRIAPLDLSIPSRFNVSRGPNSAPIVPPRPFSINRSQFPKFASPVANKNEPPPPPPRLKKAARLSLSSPTEPVSSGPFSAPCSPQNSFQLHLSNGPKPVYAVVDKAKKLADRQQKQIQLAQLQGNISSKPVSQTIEVNGVDIPESDPSQSGIPPDNEDIFDAVNRDLIAVINSRLTVNTSDGSVVEQFDSQTSITSLDATDKMPESPSVSDESHLVVKEAVKSMNHRISNETRNSSSLNTEANGPQSQTDNESNGAAVNFPIIGCVIKDHVLTPVPSSLHSSESVAEANPIVNTKTPPHEQNESQVKENLCKNDSFLFAMQTSNHIDSSSNPEKSASPSGIDSYDNAQLEDGQADDNQLTEAVNPLLVLAAQSTGLCFETPGPPSIGIISCDGYTELLSSPDDDTVLVTDIFEKELDKSLETPSQILRTDTFRSPEESTIRQKYLQHKSPEPPTIAPHGDDPTKLIQQADMCLDSVRDLLATLSTLPKTDSIVVTPAPDNFVATPPREDSPPDLDKSNDCLPSDVLRAISVDNDSGSFLDSSSNSGAFSSSTVNANSSEYLSYDTPTEEGKHSGDQSVQDFYRRSWASFADSSPSLSESSSSSGNAGRTGLPYARRRKDRSSWAEDDELSTGALGDVESSDALAQSSSEDIQSSTLLRKKRGGLGTLFRSFGKGGSSSSTTPSNSSISPSKSNFYVSPDGVSTRGNKALSYPRISTDSQSPRAEMGNRQSEPPPHPRLTRAGASRVSFASETSLDSSTGLISLTQMEEILDEEASPLSAETTVVVEIAHEPPPPIEVPKPYEDILLALPEEQKKVFRAAREILTSEQTFVNVLELLTMEFPKAITKAAEDTRTQIISPVDMEVIQGGLPNLKQVNLDLLRRLDERLSKWQEIPKVSDIFRRTGPFLKHYSVYVRDFEKIIQRIDDCCKNQQFAQALRHFESQDICQKLGIKHYMLKPVQRMPQYKLLLENYLHEIEKSGVKEDYDDTLTAIAIVKEVAEHANEAIKLQEQAEKLLVIQTRLPDRNIIRANRLLVKEGEVYKMCRKGPQPRYFVLMTDVLFCMTYNTATGAPDNKELRVRYELPLNGMTISTPDSEDIKNEFSILTEEESFSVLAKSSRERDEWIKAITGAVESLAAKARNDRQSIQKDLRLGVFAPVWVPDPQVTMCQVCPTKFTTVNRRHHCRACGKVVCSSCSGNKAPLPYKKNQAKRVCDNCFEALLDDFDKQHYLSTEGNILEIRNRFKKSSTSLHKRASIPDKYKMDKNKDHAITCSGYLHRKDKKVLRKRWFVLRDDRVLYVYAAREDPIALETLPVLGYKVEISDKVETADGHQLYAFELIHENQLFCVTLFADSSSAQDRWIEAISEASVFK